MKKIVILGSTGSIGTQTLEVIERNPSEFSVLGLAAGENVELLKKQIATYKPKVVSLEKGLEGEKTFLASKLLRGPDGLLELATLADADLVVVAVPGLAALRSTLAAIKAGKSTAIASKELLYVAGEFIMRQARASGIPVLPIDSEPSAIWQCLVGESTANHNVAQWIHDVFAEMPVSKLIITASGGPFRTFSPMEMRDVTPDMALNHPTWRMGAKNTIDSATMLNKGMEVVEAHWMFGMDWNKIEALIHPQSIVHAIVEFSDGSVKAQLAQPDMRLYIQYALHGMVRSQRIVDRLDLSRIATLTFEVMDIAKFPCYQYAVDAARAGGTYAAVASAADEVGVRLFVNRTIRFDQISHLIQEVLNVHNSQSVKSLEDLEVAHLWSRNHVERLALMMQ